MNVETINAVMRERARIRVELIRISDQFGEVKIDGSVMIPRSKVLDLLWG
jgi:hypothetical protein